LYLAPYYAALMDKISNIKNKLKNLKP